MNLNQFEAHAKNSLHEDATWDWPLIIPIERGISDSVLSDTEPTLFVAYLTWTIAVSRALAVDGALTGVTVKALIGDAREAARARSLGTAKRAVNRSDGKNGRWLCV